MAVNAIETITNAACVFDQQNDKIVLFYTTADNNEIDIINLIKDKVQYICSQR